MYCLHPGVDSKIYQTSVKPNIIKSVAKVLIFVAYKADGYKRVFSSKKFERKNKSKGETDQHSKVSHPL